MNPLRFRTRILPGAAFLFAFSASWADPAALRDARAALEALAQKHAAAPAVSLSFTSTALGADGNPMPPVKGSLLAADSGRFRLRHAQGVVVSDGVTLWQHFPSTKQVILRRADQARGAGGVLLRFLQARAIAAERVDGVLRVALDPASVGENLDSLVLTFTPAADAVRRVETQDAAGNRVEYALTALRFDARPGRGAFTLKVPAGAEVVDMR